MTLEEVKRVYAAFLNKAEGLFDEVWSINLDVITDKKVTAKEKRVAIDESDVNFIALRAEFGDYVLPVFHQAEGKARLLEAIDQAKGYLCLSPDNGLSRAVEAIALDDERRRHFQDIAVALLTENVRAARLTEPWVIVKAAAVPEDRLSRALPFLPASNRPTGCIRLQLIWDSQADSGKIDPALVPSWRHVLPSCIVE